SHTLSGAVGVLTSLRTAIYMFRLVFLTFHGPSHAAPGTGHQAPSTQHPAPSTQHPAPSTQHPAPSTQHPHDAPPAMATVLIVLAIGSVVAGYVGLGARFEHFLEPSFSPEAAPAVADEGLEVTLMVVSSVVALAGIGIAAFFFLKNRGAAGARDARIGGRRH